MAGSECHVCSIANDIKDSMWNDRLTANRAKVVIKGLNLLLAANASIITSEVTNLLLLLGVYAELYLELLS